MPDNSFMLNKMKIQMMMELEQRIEKHLKNEFYNKILPRTIDQVKKKVMIETIENEYDIDIKMTIKED